MALPVFLQAGQFANVVHLTVLMRPAQFALVSPESLNQVAGCRTHLFAILVVVNGLSARLNDFERDSAPVDASRSLAGRYLDLKGFVGVTVDCACSFVFAIDAGSRSPPVPGAPHAGSCATQDAER